MWPSTGLETVGKGCSCRGQAQLGVYRSCKDTGGNVLSNCRYMASPLAPRRWWEMKRTATTGSCYTQLCLLRETELLHSPLVQRCACVLSYGGTDGQHLSSGTCKSAGKQDHPWMLPLELQTPGYSRQAVCSLSYSPPEILKYHGKDLGP